MEVLVKAVVWLWPLTVLAKGGEWPIVGRGGGGGHGELVGKVDGGRYLSVRQRGVHAGHVQVATVVWPLAPIGRHKRWHPAAVGVPKGLALLRAVGEKVRAWWIPMDRHKEGKDGGEEGWGGKVGKMEEEMGKEREKLNTGYQLFAKKREQQKLFIKQTRPTLTNPIVCFSSPIKSAIKAMRFSPPPHKHPQISDWFPNTKRRTPNPYSITRSCKKDNYPDRCGRPEKTNKPKTPLVSWQSNISHPYTS